MTLFAFDTIRAYKLVLPISAVVFAFVFRTNEGADFSFAAETPFIRCECPVAVVASWPRSLTINQQRWNACFLRVRCTSSHLLVAIDYGGVAVRLYKIARGKKPSIVASRTFDWSSLIDLGVTSEGHVVVSMYSYTRGEPETITLLLDRNLMLLRRFAGSSKAQHRFPVDPVGVVLVPQPERSRSLVEMWTIRNKEKVVAQVPLRVEYGFASGFDGIIVGVGKRFEKNGVISRWIFTYDTRKGSIVSCIKCHVTEAWFSHRFNTLAVFHTVMSGNVIQGSALSIFRISVDGTIARLNQVMAPSMWLAFICPQNGTIFWCEIADDQTDMKRRWRIVRLNDRGSPFTVCSTPPMPFSDPTYGSFCFSPDCRYLYAIHITQQKVRCLRISIKHNCPKKPDS